MPVTTRSQAQVQVEVQVQAAQRPYLRLRRWFLGDCMECLPVTMTIQRLEEMEMKNEDYGPQYNDTPDGYLRLWSESDIAVTRGAVVATPCSRCQRGFGGNAENANSGPNRIAYNYCVTVNGFLAGACTNCHYEGLANECSLKGMTLNKPFSL